MFRKASSCSRTLLIQPQSKILTCTWTSIVDTCLAGRLQSRTGQVVARPSHHPDRGKPRLGDCAGDSSRWRRTQLPSLAVAHGRRYFRTCHKVKSDRSNPDSRRLVGVVASMLTPYTCQPRVFLPTIGSLLWGREYHTDLEESEGHKGIEEERGSIIRPRKSVVSQKEVMGDHANCLYRNESDDL